MSSSTAQFFGDRVQLYEEFIPRIVPDYHACNALMVDLAPFPPQSQLRVLDIGAGTGVLAALILLAFPNASLVAFDFSDKMLEACMTRLAEFGPRAESRLGAFPSDDFGNGYDLVVSSLAIHHLEHEDKRRGLQALASAIRPGGAIIIRDLVKAATPTLEEQYSRLWRRYVADQGHDDMSWFEAHRLDDKPATVEDHLRWLEEAGFVDAGCHWRNLNFAIFGGRKSTGRSAQ